MPNESTETVVRFGRDRIRGYYIGAALMLLIVVLNFAVGFWIEAGHAEGHRSAIDILTAVLRQRRPDYVRRGAGFAVTMCLALFVAVKLFQAGRAFLRAFVAIGPDGATLRVMRGNLGADICPSPGIVARLMAERKGTTLPAETVLPPSGKESTPRMTQAAITGGIGIGVSGVVAFGAWWVSHHVGAPNYVAEFLSLVLLGVVALTLFSTGMVLALIELNHRFR